MADNGAGNNETGEQGPNENDGAQIIWVSEDEREKLMKLSREKLINQLSDERKDARKKADDLKGVIARLNLEISDLQQANKSADDKLSNLTGDLLKAQADLQLEKDVSNKLMAKIDSNDEPSSSKPVVLIISDEDHIYKILNKNNINWLYKNVGGINELETILDTKEFAREIQTCDLLLIMVGRADLLSECDGVKMVFTLNSIVSKLSDQKVPFRIVQTLPVKGAKYKTDFTLFNRRLLVKREGNPINILKIFENLYDTDIFHDKKITILDNLLARVASEIEREIGVPDIRDKGSDPKSDGDDENELIEFIPVFKRHTGAIIGDEGDTVQKIEEETGAKVSVIDFTYKDSMRSGALITGDRSERMLAKLEIAGIIKKKDEETKSAKPKQQKRNAKPNNNPWMKKKKNKHDNGK